jgi:hypothetical protein
MAPTADENAIKILSGTFLTLTFRIETETTDFDKRLLLMKVPQQGEIKEREEFLALVANGEIPTSPVSSTSKRTSMSSSVSLPGVDSGSRRQTSASLELLPNIPSLEPMEGDFWDGVDAVGRPKELDGRPKETEERPAEERLTEERLTELEVSPTELDGRRKETEGDRGESGQEEV